MKIIPTVSPNTRTPHNGKGDDWSKWNDPPRKDNSSWRPQQRSYSHSKSYHQQTSQDYSHHSYRQAARLTAAPQLDSRPLTAFSASHQHYQTSKKRQPRSDTGHQSRGSSSPAGHIQISLKDDHKKEWIKWVKFGLNHKHRMKAAPELSEAEKPKPYRTIDHDRFHTAYSAIRSIDRRVPPEIAKLATHSISGSRLIDDIEISKAYLMELRVTNMLALEFPLPSISRFSLPEPFKGKHYTTWALIHGTPLESAQNILLEGFIRPANWAHDKDLSKSDVPTFGAFYLGREINRENSIPDCASRELMESSQKRGKGQQKVLIGALYRGADNHISYKAIGNETAQIAVAERGIATTSEKYTIAHCNHVGLQFFALKWQNLPMDDVDETRQVTTLLTGPSIVALRIRNIDHLMQLNLHRQPTPERTKVMSLQLFVRPETG